MNRDLAVMKLELIAAEAKLLAENVKNGRTWPGDVTRAAGKITSEARDVYDMAAKHRE